MQGIGHPTADYSEVVFRQQLPPQVEASTSQGVEERGGSESEVPPKLIKQRLAFHPFNLLKPDTMTERTVLPDANGNLLPMTFTVGQALAKLDARFPRERDGELSQRLRKADANKELHPLVTLAILTAHCMNGNDNRSPRWPSEMSMLAQERTNFFYNPSVLLDCNRHLLELPKHAYYPLARLMNKNAIQAYTERGLLKTPLSPGERPTVLDVGAGFGSTAKYLRKKGFEVTAIDPLKNKNYKVMLAWKLKKGKNNLGESRMQELRAMHQTTVQRYAADNPEKQFDIVHFSNITSGSDVEMVSILRAMAQLTKMIHGKMIVGICNLDVHLVSNPDGAIKPHLLSHFKKVDFIPAIKCSEFKQNHSAGGMLGFFECRDKKR